MKITVGTDIFQKYREQGYLYVDKTALVREVLNGSEVTLLPRPRRFGKTLNMTMLHAFFDMTQSSRQLFEGLAITEDADAMTHFNAHPTIFLSFKALTMPDWPSNLDELARQIAKLIEKTPLPAQTPKTVPC